MKRIAFFIYSFFCSLIAAKTVAQTGIMQAGKGWVRLEQQVIVSDKYFDSDEKLISIRTNGLFLTGIRGEYGLSRRITATGYFPFLSIASLNSIERRQTGKTVPGKLLHSFGDSEIGAKYGFLYDKRAQINLVIRMGIPFGEKNNVGTEEDIQTGDKEFNQMGGLELRYKISEYFSTGGYCVFNNRTNNFSDEIRYGFDFHYSIKKLSGSITISIVESLFNDTAPVSLNGIYSNHQEFISPGFELQYLITRKVSLHIASVFFPSGRNTLASPMIGGGLQWAIQPTITR